MGARERRTAIAALIAVSMSGALPAADDAVAVAPGQVRAADAMVLAVDFRFEPETVTIDRGDSVTWIVTRAAEPHTISPLDPPDGFEGSAFLTDGDTFEVTFRELGTYEYVCRIHPEDMQGTVVVRPEDAGDAPAPSTPEAPAPGAPTPAPAPTGTAEATPSASPGADGGPIGGAGSVVVLLVLASGLAVAGAWLWTTRRRAGR